MMFMVVICCRLRCDDSSLRPLHARAFSDALHARLTQVALGQVLHQLDDFLPFGRSVPLDDLLAVALLVFFGVRTLQVGASQMTVPTRSWSNEEWRRAW
jgi:hypothetical protein